MSKLLERAIVEVRKLPEDRQDEAAELLLGLVEQDPGSLRLSEAQVLDLKRRLADPEERRASDEEVTSTFQQLGG